MVNKVLIVENDVIIALHIKQILKSNGYTVLLTVDNYEDAVRESHKLLPDLIIMNLDLSGESTGIKAVKMINQQNIPILCISGMKTPEITEVIKLRKSCYFLAKPFLEEELLDKIKFALSTKE